MKKIFITLLTIFAFQSMAAMEGPSIRKLLDLKIQMRDQLHQEVANNDFSAVKDIIANAPEHFNQNISGSEYLIEQALCFSVQLKKDELFELLISTYPEATQIIKSHSDCLYHAANSGCLPIVKRAIELGAFIDGTSLANPLIAACQEGHSNIVRYLIEQGANMNAKEIGSEKPLAEALKSNHLKTLHTILSTIPKLERQKIEQERAGIIAGLIALLHATPKPPKDIRKMIATLLITPLVETHMDSAKQQMLNLTGSLAWTPWTHIRHEAQKSIRDILFKKIATVPAVQEEIHASNIQRCIQYVSMLIRNIKLI